MEKNIDYFKKSNVINAKISVIIPFFNTGIHIKRCLESIKNQSFDEIEIVMINDGSTDNTEDYIKEYLKLNNLCYIKLKENRGVGNARNLGIKYSSCDVIAFLDSDDWLDLDFYFELYKENEDLIVCNIMTEFENASSAQERYSYQHKNTISASLALKMFSHSHNIGNYISPLLGNKLFKKNIIINNNIFFNSNCYFEDDEFTFKYLMFCKRVIFNNKVSLHYYQRENSIMHIFTKKHIDDFFHIFNSLKNFLKCENMFEELKKEYYSLFDKCFNTIFCSLFSTIQEVNEQKKYLLYIYNKFNNLINMKEYLDYLDVTRVKEKLCFDRAKYH